MSNETLPEHLKRRFNVETVGEMWHKNLTQGNVRMRRNRHIYGMLPSNPRCVNCHRPFAGVGGVLLRTLQGVQKSTKNPRYCVGCYGFTSQFPGGAEIELTMLFADVRGSTNIAENMTAPEFSRLMNRFYEATINVLVQEDAFIDNLVGDEVTALFVPGFAGEEHARRAIKAGQELLRRTGHVKLNNPWIPVGIGIHTGTAWVGSVGAQSGAAADFTALGDNVNITARLASHAGTGEVIVSQTSWDAAQIDKESIESRQLGIKGKSEPIAVKVLHAN